MTVSSETYSINYDTDGVTTVFPAPFYFLANDHLRVWLYDVASEIETDLVLGSTFSVSGAGNPAGGSVTTTVAYPPGKKLNIERVVPITQETAYQRNDPFPERAHEQALDKLTMICQQIAAFFGLLPGTSLRALLLGKNDVDGQGAYRARGNRIADLHDPIDGRDAATRQWVQALIARLATDSTGQVVVDMLADPSSPELGDGMVAVRQPYANAFAITQHFHNLFTQTPFHYHAIGDGVVDDTVAINNTWAACAALGITCQMQKGNFAISGDLRLYSGLHVVFNSGAVLRPKKWAPSGGFVSNLNMASILDSEVENVLVENLQLDGEDIDTSEVGNSNAFGLARGARNVRLIGAVVKNLPYSWNAPGGAGGKAVMVEQGVEGFIGTHIRAEKCGTAIFVQGLPGAWADGVKKGAVDIQFGYVHAEHCDAAAVFAGVTTDSTSPTGDPSICLAVVAQLTYHNCGHAPTRVVATDHKKSAPIVFAEAQNIRIDNVKGRNDPTYPQVDPGYPTDPNVIGEGLTGPIGAIVWGWGRNISIGTIEHHGDVDSIMHIERARAHGDDAAPSGTPINVYRFDADEIKHYGTANYALTQGAGFLGPDESMTGRINITTDVLTTGFVGTDWGMTNGVTVRVRDGNTGAVVEGTPFNVRSFRNTFTGMPPAPYVDTMLTRAMQSGRFYSGEITIADDGVHIVRPGLQTGLLEISGNASELGAIAWFRCSSAGAQMTLRCPSVPNFATTVGALTGTTGADNYFTISADAAGNLYFENRRGGPVAVRWALKT